MTKKTKRNLTWKLDELPSAGELAELVNSEVITKDEAREIMFGTAENDKEKVKALESHIEFLQDLVKELTQNRTINIPYTRTIYYDRSSYWDKYWGKTHEILCNAGFDVTSGSTTLTSTTGGSLSSTSGVDADYMKLNSSGDVSLNSNMNAITVSAENKIS